MQPIEDGLFVAFEWIGARNYLKEKLPRHGKRTRGANFTRADAAVLFEHSDGKRQFVLYEPFYQFMRQQFLANEMEKAHELGADIVSVLHIAPSHNRDFRRVTSPGLAHLGDTAAEIWSRLVRIPDRFISIHTETLFSCFKVSPYPELQDWWIFLLSRYPWIREAA